MASPEAIPDLYAKEEVKNTTVYGLQFAKMIWKSFFGPSDANYNSWCNNNNINYSYATATQDMQQYKDWINPSGDTSYLNLKYQTPADMAKFIERIIGQQIKKEYEIHVSATDPLSKTQFDKEKSKSYAEILRNNLNKKISEGVGMTMHSENLETGNTSEEVEIYYKTDFKLNQEIALEIGISSVFYDNEWSEIEKKIRWSLPVYGIAGTKTWLDESGVNTREINPRNFIYPKTEKMGNLDLPWCGELIRVKIGQLKALSGGVLNDDDLKSILSKKYQNEVGGSVNMSGFDCNKYSDYEVDILDFEFKTYEVNDYNKNITSKGRVFVDKSKEQGNLPSKGGKTIYTGLWIIGTDTMVRYGRSKNMMVPVSNIADAYSGYTIYKLSEESLVKKCIPHIDELVLCYLKGQQLLSKIKPPAIAIDVVSLANVNVAGKGGKAVNTMDILEIFNQTGYALFSSKDVSGGANNYRPIYEMPMSVAAEMDTIRKQYEFALQKIRNNIGITEYSDSPPADALNGVTNAANQLTADAIWTLNDAYINIYTNTAKKVSECIKNYARYKGSFVKFTNRIGKYNTDTIEFLKDYSLCNFEFKAVAKATDEEKLQLNQDIQIALQTQEITLSDSMYIRKYVHKNVKLASQILLLRRNAQMEEKMKIAQQNAEQNAMVQQQSLQQAAQNEKEMFEMKAKIKEMEGNFAIQIQQIKNEGSLAVAKENNDSSLESQHILNKQNQPTQDAENTI